MIGNITGNVTQRDGRMDVVVVKKVREKRRGVGREVGRGNRR